MCGRLSWMLTHVRPSSATLTNGHFQDAMVAQKKTPRTFATFATGGKTSSRVYKIGPIALPDCADEHATGTPERPARARQQGTELPSRFGGVCKRVLPCITLLVGALSF